MSEGVKEVVESVLNSVTNTNVIETATVPVLSENINIVTEYNIKDLVGKLFTNKKIKWILITLFLLVCVYFYLKIQKKPQKTEDFNTQFQLQNNQMMELNNNELSRLRDENQVFKNKLFEMIENNNSNIKQVENKYESQLSSEKNKYKQLQEQLNNEKRVFENEMSKLRQQMEQKTVQHQEEVYLSESEDETVAEHELTKEEMDAINQQLEDINI